jgi:hypothetical protein
VTRLQAAGFVTCIGLAACGSQAAVSGLAQGTARPTAAPTPSPTPVSRVAPVGTSFLETDRYGNQMAIVLNRVADPVASTEAAQAPAAGSRYVAAYFQITGVSGTFTDDAYSNVVVFGTDSLSYEPLGVPIQGCSDFTGGPYVVAPVQAVRGCMVFELPTGVTVSKAQWRVDAGMAAPVTWTVG